MLETVYGACQGAFSGGQFCGQHRGQEQEGTVVLNLVDWSPANQNLLGGL